MVLPEYILVASDRQAVKSINGVIPPNHGFSSFSGQAIARKMLSQKGRKKTSICYIAFFKSIFLSLPPRRSRKPGEKLQSEGRVAARPIIIKLLKE